MKIVNSILFILLLVFSIYYAYTFGEPLGYFGVMIVSCFILEDIGDWINYYKNSKDC